MSGAIPPYPPRVFVASYLNKWEGVCWGGGFNNLQFFAPLQCFVRAERHVDPTDRRTFVYNIYMVVI